MWSNVCRSYMPAQTAATETRQAFPAFLRDPPASNREERAESEGEEMRMVPRMHGSALPDVGRPSGFLSAKPDIAPVAELVTEAEEYVRASDPLMAGMGDGKGAPWVPEKFVGGPDSHTGSSFDSLLEEEGIKEEVEQAALKRLKIVGEDNIARPAHYARYAIEPCTFILANELPFAEGNVVKYICRWRFKNGREDLEKAKRYIEMILEDLDRKEAGTVTDCVGKPL